MADKITLTPVTGAANIATLNGNFDKIENALNDKVMYRNIDPLQPGQNQMEADIDMNGNHIYNLPFPTSRGEPLTRDAVETTLAILDKNMDHYQEANAIMEYTIASAASTLQNKLDAEDAARRAEEAASGGGGGTAGVASFNGRTGAVTPRNGDYSPSMVGLGNVDNTADLAKPVSTAQSAINTNLQTQIDALSVGGPVEYQWGKNNILMNGDFHVSQRSPTTVGLNGTGWLGDRWYFSNGWSGSSVETGAFYSAYSGNYGQMRVVTPGNVASAVGATFIQQYMDNREYAKLRTSGGMFSFDVVMTAGIGDVVFCTSVNYNPTNVPERRICYRHVYTGNGNWQRFSVYIPPMIQTDPMSTTGHQPAFAISLVFGAGTSVMGQYFNDTDVPQTWPASGHSWGCSDITQFGLKTGAAVLIRKATLEVSPAILTTKPSDCPHHPRPYAVDLAACQTYFQYHPYVNFTGTATAINQIMDINYSLGVPMRKTPAVTIGGQLGQINMARPTMSDANNREFWFQSSAITGAGRAIYRADVAFDAEFGT